MATKLPYVLPFEDGAEVAAILLKAQGLPDAGQIATKTELQQATAYLATLDNATMAPQSATVKRETDNLQAQINNIVRAPESGGDVGAEVYQARVGADGTSYQTLKERLDSEYEMLDATDNSLKDDITSLVSDLMLATDTDIPHVISDSYHTTGMRGGYWDDSGSVESNSNWLCSASKIRSYATTEYSDYFKEAYFAVVSFPADALYCRIKVWSQSDVLESRFDVQSGEIFQIIPDKKYALSFRFPDGTASTYLTDEWAAQVIIRKYTDRLDSSLEEINADLSVLSESVDTLTDLTTELESALIKDAVPVSGFPYGLRTGYWGTDASLHSSSSYLATAAKIRTYFSDTYPDFFDGAVFASIAFPADVIRCAVYAFDANNNLKQSLNLNSGDVFPIISGTQYAISFRLPDGTASTYLTDEWTNQVIITRYLDKIREIETEMDVMKEAEPLHELRWDWMNSNVGSTYAYGWRVGYYRSDNGNYDSSAKYLCTRQFSCTAGGGLDGVKKIDITVPDAYSVAIAEWDASGQYLGRTGSITAGQTPHIVKELVAGNTYAFMIGRWANDDAASYRNASFLNQVSTILFSNTEYLPNSEIFLRFNVTTNLSWCNIESTGSTNQEPDVPQTVRCILRLPANYSALGKPVPLIMFGHGAGGHVTDSAWYGNNTTTAVNGNHLKLMNAFVEAGYAIFDVSNSRNDPNDWPDWGCTPLMNAYIAAWNYIKANYNVEKERIFCLSASMGTVTNLNFMKWYHSCVAASIMLAPRPICSARYADQDESMKRKMEAAFGITTEGVWDYDRLKSFDYYENIVNLDNIPITLERTPPVKVLVGTADTSYLTEVRAYYAALRNSGNYVNYREVTGANHGDMCTLRSPYTDLQIECIDWFNRFRFTEAAASDD